MLWRNYVLPVGWRLPGGDLGTARGGWVLRPSLARHDAAPETAHFPGIGVRRTVSGFSGVPSGCISRVFVGLLAGSCFGETAETLGPYSGDSAFHYTLLRIYDPCAPVQLLAPFARVFCANLPGGSWGSP